METRKLLQSMITVMGIYGSVEQLEHILAAVPDRMKTLKSELRIELTQRATVMNTINNSNNSNNRNNNCFDAYSFDDDDYNWDYETEEFTNEIRDPDLGTETTTDTIISKSIKKRSYSDAFDDEHDGDIDEHDGDIDENNGDTDMQDNDNEYFDDEHKRPIKVEKNTNTDNTKKILKKNRQVVDLEIFDTDDEINKNKNKNKNYNNDDNDDDWDLDTTIQFPSGSIFHPQN